MIYGGIMHSKNSVMDDLMKHKFFESNPNNLNVLLKYITSRIDLKSYGSKDNNLILLENSDSDSDVQSPFWLKDYRGSGWTINSIKGVIDLKIKFINDGRFKLFLLGVDFRNQSNYRVPIYINYTKLEINGMCVFDSHMEIWHDNHYEFIKDVEDGEIMNIHVEWEPFH